jgi:hypothetical protein
MVKLCLHSASRRWKAALLVAVALATVLASSQDPRAVSSDVVISEFRVRGPNGGNDEFVELYNASAAAVNIGGWKINGSNSGGATSTRATVLAGTVLSPGCHFLVTNSGTSGGPYSGPVAGNQTYSTGITDDGGIALLNSSNVIVDQVGMSTGSAYKEGTPLPNLGTSNQNRGYERKPGGASGSGTDTDNNAADFQLINPSTPQNLSSPCVGVSRPPAGTGAATPSVVTAGNTTLLTVVVTPGAVPASTGLAVTADLSAIGGSATQTLYNDGTNGDVTSGDNTFSYLATIPAGAAPGPRSLGVTVSDAEGRTGSATIALTVQALPTAPVGTGEATPDAVSLGGVTLLKVTVTPGTNPPSTGLGVSADLSTIGGSSPQAFYDNGTNGDAVAGDNVFSYQAMVPSSATVGSKSLAVTITDAMGRSGTTAIALTVEPVLTAIYDIQGPGNVSPYAGEAVKTTGIVTALKYNGFFIQVPDGETDGTATTSDGVFVYTGGAPPAAAVVGNSVKVVGTVQEYVPSADALSPPMTEIGAATVAVVSSGNALPTPATVTAGDMTPTGGFEQLERYEGMRVRLSLTVVAPTGGYVTEKNATGSSDSVFYGVITGLARPFREPGIGVTASLPNGAPPDVPRFDDNPERLRVDSDAQRGAPILDVVAGQMLPDLVGVVDYAYRLYTILPDPGTMVTGNAAAIPVPPPAPNQFTVASFNMERFYDTVNDTGVDDVALTALAFNNRLNKASLTIRHVMRMPDIIGVQEVENLATLQAIATRVNADAVAEGSPNPDYQAYLEEGNDIGGIDVGFLVKASSVQVTSVTQVGKDATYIDPNTGMPALLNDRPPLVLRAVIPDPRGGAFPLTVIVNHLRSLSGVDDLTDGRVRAKRRAGAEFLANLIQGYQQAGEHVVSVGDYNAYQFNDGYVDVIGTILGVPTPPDQVMLASSDLVDPNLTDLVDFAPPAERYSYVENGSAQVLDHVLVSANMLAHAAALSYARCNADFPEVFRSDPDRPERLSDHDPAVAYFTFPTADMAVATSAAPNPVDSGSTLTYTVSVTNTAKDPAINPVVTDTLPLGVTVISVVTPDGWTCAQSDQTVTCSAPSLAADTTATLTITASVDGNLADGVTLSSEAAVTAATFDPNLANNTRTFVSTVRNPPPAITMQPAAPAVLWPVNHKMVNVTLDYDVTDNFGTPVCSAAVTSSEAANGRGDGNTPVDWLVIDPHHVQLRAERSGTGTGRIYTIAVTCADSAGGTSSQTTLVTVPKSNGK